MDHTFECALPELLNRDKSVKILSKLPPFKNHIENHFNSSLKPSMFENIIKSEKP